MIRIRTSATGLSGGEWLSTLYFDEASSTAADAHASVVDFWTDMQIGIHQSVEMIVESEVVNIDPVTGQAVSFANVPSVTIGGQSTDNPLAAATQGVLRLRTAAVQNGRRTLGKVFLWGATEGASTGGRPNDAYRTLVNGATLGLVGNPDAPVVVWSRVNGNQSVVTSADLWTQWGVQRSRRD